MENDTHRLFKVSLSNVQTHRITQHLEKSSLMFNIYYVGNKFSAFSSETQDGVWRNVSKHSIGQFG